MTLYYLGVVEYERRNWKVQGKPSTVNTGKVFKRWDSFIGASCNAPQANKRRTEKTF